MGDRVDEDLTPRDRLGRQVPHRFGFVQIAKTLPGLVDQFSTIPTSAWNQDVDDDGDNLAVVACPCGETPEVELNRLTHCACHRFFLFTGQAVKAANRPGQYAEQPVDPEAVPTVP